MRDRGYWRLLQYMKGAGVRQIARAEGVSQRCVSAGLRRLGVNSVTWNQKYIVAARNSRIPYKARKAYSTQKSCAKARGIDWKFDLESWWEIWQHSGKWDSRGKGLNRFVMARTNDFGPYAPENVRICTHSENISEYQRRSAEGICLLNGIAA